MAPNAKKYFATTLPSRKTARVAPKRRKKGHSLYCPHERGGLADPEENKKMLSLLTGGLLWNFNTDLLDYKRDKDTIIERILDAGLENDEIIMWRYYSYKDIKRIALNMDGLQHDKITYLSCVLNVKEEDFKCFGKKPWYQK